MKSILLGCLLLLGIMIFSTSPINAAPPVAVVVDLSNSGDCVDATWQVEEQTADHLKGKLTIHNKLQLSASIRLPMAMPESYAIEPDPLSVFARWGVMYKDDRATYNITFYKNVSDATFWLDYTGQYSDVPLILDVVRIALGVVGVWQNLPLNADIPGFVDAVLKVPGFVDIYLDFKKGDAWSVSKGLIELASSASDWKAVSDAAVNCLHLSESQMSEVQTGLRGANALLTIWDLACMQYDTYKVTFLTDCWSVNLKSLVSGSDKYILPIITASAKIGQAPQNVSFSGNLTAHTGNITSYHWDFGDGSQADGVSVSHTFTKNRRPPYIVSLAVTSDDGLVNTAYTQIALGDQTTGYQKISGCTLTEDTHWTTDADVYLVEGPVIVPTGVTLTIDPGVIVKFKDTNSYIGVYGTLIAHGTDQDRVFFTSFRDDTLGGDTNGDKDTTTPAKGDWGGVLIYGSTDAASSGSASLDHCVLRYGGSSNSSGNYIKGIVTGFGSTGSYPDHTTYGTLTISNSEISHSSSSGIYCYQYFRSPNQNPLSVSGCTISDCLNYGIYSNLWRNTSVKNCSVSNCGKNGIDLTSTNGSLDNCSVSACSNIGINVSNNYSISILGTSVSECNSYAAYLRSSTINSDISKIALSGNRVNGVAMDGCILGVDSTWDNAALHYIAIGAVTVPSSKTLTIAPGMIVKGSTGGYISVQGTLNAQGTASQPIYFTSYADDSVGGDTNGDSSSSSPAKGDWGGILVIGGRNADGGGTATLDHCVLRYGGSSVNYIRAIVTGYGDTGSYPDHMTYGTLTISNSEISHSSSSGVYCYQYFDAPNRNPISIIDCTISDCSNYGIYANRWLTAEINDCAISECAAQGIFLVNSTASISGTQVSKCNSEGVHISSCTLSNDLSNIALLGNKVNAVILEICNLGVNSTWNSSTTCYALTNGGLTIPSGKILTISPGTIVKGSTGGYISVQGTLNAQGTASQPIYFTSYADDSVGGDTNGDSSSSSPAKGDWGGILVIGGRNEDGGGTATLDHCVLRYGGSVCNGDGYYIRGIVTGWGNTSSYPSRPTYGTLTVSNSEVSHSSSSGIYCYQYYNAPNQNPVSISGCTINDCSNYGICSNYWRDMFVKNCIISGNQTGLSLVNTSTSLIYSNLWGNSVNYSGASLGIGCMSADPRFVSATDYHLQPDSPCIDTGDPSIFDPDGTRSDMGAYRFSDHTPPLGTGDTKSKIIGQPVDLKTMYVTAVFDGFFYVEDHNRSNGIRIERKDYSIAAGTIVDLSGTSGETPSGERCILADTVTSIGSSTIAPLGTTNRTLASGAFGYQKSSWQWQWIEDKTDSITDYRQRKLVDGKIIKECWRPCAGLNTTGLYVKVWGTAVGQDTMNHLFYLDDGSKLTNYDRTRHGIKVIWSGALPSDGVNIIITGVASCEWDATCLSEQKSLLPVILATSVSAQQ